jgi:hypothetical protein
VHSDTYSAGLVGDEGDAVEDHVFLATDAIGGNQRNDVGARVALMMASAYMHSKYVMLGHDDGWHRFQFLAMIADTLYTAYLHDTLPVATRVQRRVLRFRTDGGGVEQQLGSLQRHATRLLECKQTDRTLERWMMDGCTLSYGEEGVIAS